MTKHEIETVLGILQQMKTDLINRGYNWEESLLEGEFDAITTRLLLAIEELT